MKLIKYVLLIAIIPLVLALASCNHHPSTKVIKLGTMEGPEAAEWETAKKIALKRYGLHIKLIKFSSYNLPNEALNSGDLDANAFQHLPFLEAEIKARGYKLIPITKTFLSPTALYSKKITQLSQLKKGDKIGVPNDPSNEARALLLLQKGNLIKLRKGTGVTATPVDIISNPKQLKIVELPADQLPRSLQDLAAAVITNNFATAAGLKLSDGLLIEDIDSPYMNVIVIRPQDKDKKEIKQLVKAFQTPEVIAVAKKVSNGAVVAGW